MKFVIWFVPRLVYRFVVAGIAITALVGAMLLGSVAPALTASVASLAGAVGISTVAETLQRDKAKKAKRVNKRIKGINKRINWRTKRIVAVNAIGAVASVAVPIAIGAATYEAWMICENSNDTRELIRLVGVEPEPDTIGDTCEDLEREWNESAEWVKVHILGEVEDAGSVYVYIDGQGWTDITDW